ncbi:hypothetical protein ACQP1G_22845 [Nocardia sp. CA-107356]|uniref:hypothetical protein n=1 Tax=Nocardia sp. CA-107356 TaxID=3239972 RepID=UPI003D91672A
MITMSADIITSRTRSAAALLVAAAGILATGAISTGTATYAAPIVPATTCDSAAGPDCSEPDKTPERVIVPAPMAPILTPAAPPPPAKPGSPAAALTPPPPGPNLGAPIVPAEQ